MNKSTAIIIFIIYLASIIIIGFFGMNIKAYDLQKYVKTIEIERVEASEEGMISKFEEIPNTDPNSKDRKYYLEIDFSYAKPGPYDNGEIKYDRNQLSMTLIPKITYTSDEQGKGESIKYIIEDAEIEKREEASLSRTGVLTCYKKNTFKIFVKPESISKNGSDAIIYVNII